MCDKMWDGPGRKKCHNENSVLLDTLHHTSQKKAARKMVIQCCWDLWEEEKDQDKDEINAFQNDTQQLSLTFENAIETTLLTIAKIDIYFL